MLSPHRFGRLLLAAAALASLTGAAKAKMDPANPTCPLSPDWSANPTMQLTPVKKGDAKVLLAEGRIDAGLPDRLKAALVANPDVSEIWLRSPGGDARAGNAAGRVIRTEQDRGLILLLDDRYYDPRYTRLLPPDWRWINEDIQGAATALNLLEAT